MGAFSGSNTETTSNNTLVPWGPGRIPMETMMGDMVPAYAKAKEAADRGTPDDFMADLNEQQRQAISGLGSSAWTHQAQAQAGGIYNQGNQLAQQGGDTMAGIASGDIKGGVDQDVFNQFYNQDLLQSQVDAAGADIRRNLQEGEMLNIDRNFAGMGGAGSSRAGVAEGVAIRGAQDRLTDTSTALQTNMFNNALGQAASFGQNNFAAQQGAAGNMLNTGANMRQAGMDAQAGYASQANQNLMNAGGLLQGQSQAEIDAILAKQQADIGLPMQAIGQGLGITAPVTGQFGTQHGENEVEAGGGFGTALMGMVGSAVGGAMSK